MPTIQLTADTSKEATARVHAESIVFSQEALELLEISYGGRMHITCQKEDMTAFAVVPTKVGHKLNKARTVSVKGAHEYLVRGEYSTTDGVNYKLIEPEDSLLNVMLPLDQEEEEVKPHHYRLSRLAARVRMRMFPYGYEAANDNLVYELEDCVMFGDFSVKVPGSPSPSCSFLASTVRLVQGNQDNDTYYYHGSLATQAAQ